MFIWDAEVLRLWLLCRSVNTALHIVVPVQTHDIGVACELY